MGRRRLVRHRPDPSLTACQGFFLVIASALLAMVPAEASGKAGPPGQPVGPPGPPVIVFSGAPDAMGFEQIWTMAPDGSGQVDRTHASGLNEEPDWSPSATKIAFRKLTPSGNSIFTMSASGGQQKMIYEDGDPFQPAWSPDGTKIAFTRETGQHLHQVWVMNSTGTNAHAVGDNDGSSPAWSPDGTTIAFVQAGPTDKRDIWTMKPDGSDQTDLTPNNAGNDFVPAWKPDGAKIVFETDRDGNREIYVMSKTGGNKTRLTNDPAADQAPDWSADGAKIAFFSKRVLSYPNINGGAPGPWPDVFTMDADGSNQVNITTNTPNQGAARYPDYGRPPLPPAGPVAAKYLVLACPSGGEEGNRLRVNGSLFPFQAGILVAVDFISPAGAIHTETAPVDALGNFSTSHEAYDDGRWTIRARLPAEELQPPPLANQCSVRLDPNDEEDHGSPHSEHRGGNDDSPRPKPR